MRTLFIDQVKVKDLFLKIMFLAAVARPRYDLEKGEMFDGKIGIRPFEEVVKA